MKLKWSSWVHLLTLFKKAMKLTVFLACSLNKTKVDIVDLSCGWGGGGGESLITRMCNFRSCIIYNISVVLYRAKIRNTNGVTVLLQGKKNPKPSRV